MSPFLPKMRRDVTVPSPAPRVLVVDDDADIRAALTEALEQEGFQVREAIHGADALRSLRGAAELPNVVLLDLMMPVMSGWDFWTEVQRDPRLATVPIVVLSAGSPEGLVGLEPERYLAKPVDLNVLIETVRRCC